MIESIWTRARSALEEPVSSRSLGMLRLFIGAAFFLESIYFFIHDWNTRFFIDQKIHFGYFGTTLPSFDSALVVNSLIVLMLVSSLMMMIGVRARVSAITFLLIFGYFFLLESLLYRNHHYLMCLLALYVALLPQGLPFSFSTITPKKTVMAAYVWLFRIQIGLVYLYGGIAKLNPDWLSGEPIRGALQSTNYGLQFGVFADSEALVYAIAYGGILVDLSVFPALLYRRTRLYAIPMVLMFNMMNLIQFNISNFTWLMMFASTIYLDPDWPKQLSARFLGRGAKETPAKKQNKGKGKQFNRKSKHPEDLNTSPHMIKVIVILLAFQVLFPLRQFAYPGLTGWTMDAHYFSWRMMSYIKTAKIAMYVVGKESGQTVTVNLPFYMKEWQLQKFPFNPNHVVYLAHKIKDEWKARMGEDVRITTNYFASINFRAPARVIDANRDLLEIPLASAGASDWILPVSSPPRSDPSDEGFRRYPDF